jgi:hypothetical protein
MGAAGEGTGSGYGKDWNCKNTNEVLGPKLDSKDDVNTLLLIAQRDLSRTHNTTGGKTKPAATKVTFDDRIDTEEAVTTKAKSHWRDDHLTVPDGPGWVFSTKDGMGWNQDAFKEALAGAIKNKEGDKNVKRERTDTDESKNGRDGNTRTRRY